MASSNCRRPPSGRHAARTPHARRTHAHAAPALRPLCARSAPALRQLCAPYAPLRSAPLRATPALPLPIDLPPPSARAGLCVAGGDRTLGVRLPRGARHAARARNAAAAAGQRRRPLARRGAARRVSGAAHRRPRRACRAATGGKGNYQQSCLIQAFISKEEHVHCLLSMNSGASPSRVGVSDPGAEPPVSPLVPRTALEHGRGRRGAGSHKCHDKARTRQSRNL